MKILGISAFYHDSAAAILVEGKIIAAAQEERFTRIKHDSSYPFNAINFVLSEAKIDLNKIDKIVFYEKPFLKFERILETYLAMAPKGFFQFIRAIPIWLKEKLFQKKMLIELLKKNDQNFNNNEKIFFSEHHLSHAASAFYPSPYEKALILTADGVGEWATTTIAIGNKNKISINKEIHFPHSLGLLYSAFTYYIGFKVNSGEYKLMGLAPYGEPKYKDKILDCLIDVKEDGSFRLNQEYFNYTTGLTMTSKKFHNLFGEDPRNSLKEEITQFHMDIAASIQCVTEEIMIKICKSIKEEFKVENLCLAGGVALNCVVNGKILEKKIFKNVWIQPAAGDAGGSLGAALAYWYNETDHERICDDKDQMQGSFLGPEFNDDQIQKSLDKLGAKYQKLNQKDMINITAESLSNGLAVGWFQGKMEFGPRALGSRSILGDPRSTTMQKSLNLKVKYRESFRPFAPAVLRENLSDWFDLDYDSQYMLIVSKVKKNKSILMNEAQSKLFGIEKLNIKRSEIPAVTHVDYSARLQTVDKDTNNVFYNLIKRFNEITGCPMVINTSFNVRGEPIVNTPEDAFKCFMGTELDVLSIGNFYLKKKDQDKSLKNDYVNKFELD
jgi:carbamoyltransferase